MALESEKEKNQPLSQDTTTSSSSWVPLHTLPEMYFGSNQLQLYYKNQLVVSFTPQHALKTVEVGAQSQRWQLLKVAHPWKHKTKETTTICSSSTTRLNRDESQSSSDHHFSEMMSTEDMDLRSSIQMTPKPYDWTFFSRYSGTLHPQGKTWEPTHSEIPLDQLKVPEPILFYTETVLFEDELSDNGVSKYSIRL
ncbi:hypothetical protein HMI56_005520, partial [Coelomomyces lativittatus]